MLSEKAKTVSQSDLPLSDGQIVSGTLFNDDKLFFEQLVIGGQRPILLTRKHLEMPYREIGKYQHDNHWFGGDVELLSRLTIREVLGKEFGDKHQRRI